MGVWIEIVTTPPTRRGCAVTPCVGVWIEMPPFQIIKVIFPLRSLPAWECGLKLPEVQEGELGGYVTPCVGVWIEIIDINSLRNLSDVTPCVGVWIEIGAER